MRKTAACLLALFILVVCCVFSVAEEETEYAQEEASVNALTLIDQQDREIEVKKGKDPAVKKGVSQVTGQKSDASYQPVLVEFNNENGGIYATAPKGITKASVIYEYQISTNGTMGLSAIYQDELPAKVGPVGNATIGGLLIEDDWKCGYVYNSIPTAADGSVSELGYSMQTWIDRYDLMRKHLLFPANVPRTKEWKAYFKQDSEMIMEESQNVDVKGIQGLLDKYSVVPSPARFDFLAKPDDYEGSVFVKEIDIRTSSRTFSSGFVYNDEDHQYYRWIGDGNQYGDVEADEQLHVSNLIIQRVEYNTSNKNMAPIVIGKGNADIFIRGYYIDGYWVRESSDDHTRYYDSDGNPIQLDPGTTFISLLTNSTSVVILNY